MLYALPAGTWQLHCFCLPGLYYSTSLTGKPAPGVPEASPPQSLHSFCPCSLSSAPSLGQQLALPSPDHPSPPDKPAILARVFSPRQEGRGLLLTGCNRAEGGPTHFQSFSLSTVLSFPLCPVLSKMLRRHGANLFWVLTQPNILYREVNLHPSGRYSCVNFLCDKVFVLA